MRPQHTELSLKNKASRQLSVEFNVFSSKQINPMDA